jgi:integrase
MLIIKTLLYTGDRVSELINMKLIDVDFQECQIRVNQGKGKKDRIIAWRWGKEISIRIKTHDGYIRLIYSSIRGRTSKRPTKCNSSSKWILDMVYLKNSSQFTLSDMDSNPFFLPYRI